MHETEQQANATITTRRSLRDILSRCYHAAFPASATPQSYEEMALRLLAENRELGLAALVTRLAEEAMRAERVRGGATVDVGVWGPAVYYREALATVQRMLGRTLVLEGEGPFMLVVPTVSLPVITRRPRFIAAFSGV